MLRGTYGLVVLFRDEPGLMIAARCGSPLVLGVGKGEQFIASDTSPLIGYTDRIIYLADHQMAVLTQDTIQVLHRESGKIRPEVRVLEHQSTDVSADGFAHYMLKEIHEQPNSMRNAMRGRLDRENATAKFGGLNLTPRQLRSIDRIILTGCGTSWHAALVGEYLIEEFARIPVEVEYASELRYRNPRSIAIRLSSESHRAGDGRYFGGFARDEAERAPHLGHLQRHWKQHCTRSGRRGLFACRSGGGRCFH